MKLRSHLITLVVVVLLPLLIFASVMIIVFGKEQRAAVEVGLVDTARALSLAIDRELLASIRTLQALATSKHLDSGDLRNFYDQAKRVLRAQGGWETILLVDPSGQQLINLRQPFGSPLPRSGAPDLIKQVFDTGRPAVSNLFWGHIAQRYLVGIDVPVIRDGRVRYVLTASTSPMFLVKLLREQKIPPDWLSTIIDRNKIIIARTRGLEQFLGKPAGPLFAAKSREAEEVVWRGIPHDGPPVYAALHRSELSGWTVGLAIPVSVAETPMRRSLIIVALGGLALLTGGIALAFIFGQRITKPIAALSASAEALGRGETPQIDALPIIELDQVARALKDAAAKREWAEEALRKSEERYRLIVETMNDIVYKVATTENDPFGGTVQFVSSQVENILGYRPDEFTQEPGLWFRILHPDDVPGLVESSRKILASGNAGIREYRLRHKEKADYRWMEDRVVPLIDNQGQVIGIQGVARDITERKRLEREISEISERERERIGQDLHDGLGQDLTGVALITKGLEHKLAAKSLPEVADAAQISDQINRAIIQTRNLARGLYPVELVQNGLMSALEELASNAERLFEISCQFKCDQPIVIDDNSMEIHLYRIAQEAVDNAVKHGKAAQVLIDLSTADGRTALSVSDDGVGFQGVPRNDKGIGLHIMKRRAEMIGAALDIRQGDHGGTVVTCSFLNTKPVGEVSHGGKSTT